MRRFVIAMCARGAGRGERDETWMSFSGTSGKLPFGLETCRFAIALPNGTQAEAQLLRRAPWLRNRTTDGTFVKNRTNTVPFRRVARLRRVLPANDSSLRRCRCTTFAFLTPSNCLRKGNSTCGCGMADAQVQILCGTSWSSVSSAPNCKEKTRAVMRPFFVIF